MSRAPHADAAAITTLSLKVVLPLFGEPASVRGFVRTPQAVVDSMVDLLFADAPPGPSDRILDPGCGDGAFIDGIVRWCRERGIPTPTIVGIENEPTRAAAASAKFSGYPSISVRCTDFLKPQDDRFEYIVANPPYVSLPLLASEERQSFRQAYGTARGRFDLYMLFFEQSLKVLSPGGRLVFVTPEKYLYVNTAAPLRQLLAGYRIVSVELVDEDIFTGLITYPAITVVANVAPGTTRLRRRDGSHRVVRLPGDGKSWLPLFESHRSTDRWKTLGDVCVRVSCGVATGADEVFVRRRQSIPVAWERFAYPTVSGRQLGRATHGTVDSILVPYDSTGRLLPLSSLGSLADHLRDNKDLLAKRVCAQRKPWHAFHDSVPFGDMLRPKLLCKDITASPDFWIDRDGAIVPRHSVYYVVPRDPSILDDLSAYLRGESAQKWLRANCQRAAKGFFRVQSSVLKRLPVPKRFSADTAA